MDVELKYGKGSRLIKIPSKAKVTMLNPATLPALGNISGSLDSALSSPVERPALVDYLSEKRPKTISIAISDESRPVPVKAIIPSLLKHLYKALPGLKPSDVTIVIGGGLHPPPDKAGIERIIPSSLTQGCRVTAHDAISSKVSDFGVTTRGTPVRINRELATGDCKISIGLIDPHQFVGFTGGAKGVVIGCAAAETIEHNHKLMYEDNAQVGRLEGNPVREDLNEAGDRVGIDYAINVVLNGDKKAVELFCGEPKAVLKKGAAVCASLYGVGIKKKFDMVIASCGGFPKDICLYQAQKGLNLASHAVREGGKILLLAASSQGVGDDVYLDYVSRFATPREVLDDFAESGFKMGAHKAYLFGRTLASYDVAVASELDADVLRTCQLKAVAPDSTIEKWVRDFEGRPRVAVVPNANTTYFYQEGLEIKGQK